MPKITLRFKDYDDKDALLEVQAIFPEVANSPSKWKIIADDWHYDTHTTLKRWVTPSAWRKHVILAYNRLLREGYRYEDDILVDRNGKPLFEELLAHYRLGPLDLYIYLHY